MALVVNDRVKETTTTTGTGDITFAGAATGFETFASGIGNSNTTYYAIALQGGSEFEVGLGTLSADSSTMARTTIISSSNSDSVVNFSAGTKDVFCTLPASKATVLDASGNLAGLTMSGNIDVNGNELILDADADTSITADTDDQIDFKVGGTDRMVIDSSGKVGIGTTSPGETLDVNGTVALSASTTESRYIEIGKGRGGNGYAYIDLVGDATYTDYGLRLIRGNTGANTTSVIEHRGTGAFQIKTTEAANIDFYTSNAFDFRMATNGDFHADGDVIAYSTTTSDVRLKSDVEPITNALSKVNQLSGYTFTRKHNGQKSAGILAHELEKVLPEAVREKELPLQQDDGEKYKVVEYDAIHGLLIEAIKELSDKVKYLEERLEIKDGLENK